MSVALSGLVLNFNFVQKTHFCRLYAYLLACFSRDISQISYISQLFSLRRFRTVETIPIFKSKDDRADTRFRNS